MAERMRIAEEVAAALAGGGPVVALESTLIVHGLPRPDNLGAAQRIEGAVREAGAVPAIVAVLDGVPAIGLGGEDLERLLEGDVRKIGVRDLAPAAAASADGATTVSATAVLAGLAGIRLFATGGLGGVHRGARDSWDVSTDLVALGGTRVGVVCSGVKSILDIGATLEALEALGVTVVGYGTDRFPGFYLADSGHDLDWRVDTPHEAAAVLRAADALGLPARATVFANPPPSPLDPGMHDQVLADALAAADRAGVRGKAVTPFLLDRFHAATGGESLRANVDLAVANAGLAARIAASLADG